HGPYGVGDLLAAAVADGDVDHYAVDVRRALLGLFEGGLHPGGQQVGGADVVHTPASVGGEAADHVLDDAEQGDELFLGAVEVVRRQQPQGDDLDVRLRAPAEELLDLVCARAVAVDGAGSRGFGPPAVPVHDDADVLGHLSGVQVAFHPACVQPDQQATQLVAQVHVIVSPSVRIGQTRHPAAGPRHGDPVVVAGGPCPYGGPRVRSLPPRGRASPKPGVGRWSRVPRGSGGTAGRPHRVRGRRNQPPAEPWPRSTTTATAPARGRMPNGVPCAAPPSASRIWTEPSTSAATRTPGPAEGKRKGRTSSTQAVRYGAKARPAASAPEKAPTRALCTTPSPASAKITTCAARTAAGIPAGTCGWGQCGWGYCGCGYCGRSAASRLWPGGGGGRAGYSFDMRGTLTTDTKKRAGPWGGDGPARGGVSTITLRK